MIKQLFRQRQNSYNRLKDNLYKDKAFLLFITWYFLALYLVLARDGRVTALPWSIPGVGSGGMRRQQSHPG